MDVSPNTENLGWCVALRDNTPYKNRFGVIQSFVCTPWFLSQERGDFLEHCVRVLTLAFFGCRLVHWNLD